MGLAEAAIVVAAIGAASTAYGAVASNRAGKKQRAAQEEASDTAAAQQKAQEMEQRRQQVRQQRIRAAQIEQGAANQGVVGSSGEVGSLSALATNTSNNLAFMSGNSLAAQGIATANQQALNAQGEAQDAAAIGQLGGAALNLSASAAGKGLANLFGTPSPKTTK